MKYIVKFTNEMSVFGDSLRTIEEMCKICASADISLSSRVAGAMRPAGTPSLLIITCDVNLSSVGEEVRNSGPSPSHCLLTCHYSVISVIYFICLFLAYLTTLSLSLTT
jgi:hypothetical protein